MGHWQWLVEAGSVLGPVREDGWTENEIWASKGILALKATSGNGKNASIHACGHVTPCALVYSSTVEANSSQVDLYTHCMLFARVAVRVPRRRNVVNTQQERCVPWPSFRRSYLRGTGTATCLLRFSCCFLVWRTDLRQ